MSDPVIDSPEKKKKGGGCFGTGCLVLVIVFLLIGAMGVFGYRSLVKKGMEYTSETPDSIPVETVQDGEYDMLVKRVNGFGSGGGTTLTLTAHDMNVMFQHQQSSTKGFFTISGAQLIWQFSMSMDMFPGFGGRYLNGTITMAPTGTDGELHVPVTGIKLKGKTLSDDLVSSFSKGFERSFTQKLMQYPATASILTHMQKLEVKDDALVFTVK